MANSKPFKIVSVATCLLMLVALSSITVPAQAVKVEGLIKGRSGATMILQTSDSSTLIVLLTDDTEVAQVQGMLKARRKQMSMVALIPGLPVQVEGIYDDQSQLVAKSVKFKGNDLEQAQSMQAGLHETQMQTQKNQTEIERQNALLRAQQAQLTEQQAKLAANKAAIEAAVARFGQLDDYYILDEVTVYFGNGKVKVDPKTTPNCWRWRRKRGPSMAT